MPDMSHAGCAIRREERTKHDTGDNICDPSFDRCFKIDLSNLQLDSTRYSFLLLALLPGSLSDLDYLAGIANCIQIHDSPEGSGPFCVNIALKIRPKKSPLFLFCHTCL